MKKRIFAALFITVLVLTVLCGCRADMHGYSKMWILGRNSSQIMDRYGIFDMCGEAPGTDGLYKDTCCAYYVELDEQGSEKGNLAVITIWFNEKGIAYKCFEEIGTKGG